ncbi:hypothetical protein HOY80DRAFT_981693 [Tuber brumale]|nr:hypothetical protein HOY80DRAFT_981693 [Tuber brumale]
MVQRGKRAHCLCLSRPEICFSLTLASSACFCAVRATLGRGRHDPVFRNYRDKHFVTDHMAQVMPLRRHFSGPHSTQAVPWFCRPFIIVIPSMPRAVAGNTIFFPGDSPTVVDNLYCINYRDPGAYCISIHSIFTSVPCGRALRLVRALYR